MAGIHWTDTDLWQQMECLLSQLGGLLLSVHWMPSHLDMKLMECPFEEWCCEWNGRIDRAVARFNFDRPASFWALHTAASDHHRLVCRRLQQLRTFFFSVAAVRREDTPSLNNSLNDVEVVFDFVEEHHGSLHDFSEDDPHSLVNLAGWNLSKVPSQFMVNLLTWIFEHSSDDSSVYPLSFIELTLVFADSSNAQFPFWCPRSNSFELSLLSMRNERPTLSQLLSLVRSACRHFVGGCDIGDVQFHGRNKLGLGLCRPVDGLYVRLVPSVVQRCQDLTLKFFHTRRYRKANDLARPV